MTPSIASFASRKIAVNGVTLNVIVEGEGPDVLLVHGFPDSHQVWRHQGVEIQNTRGCHAYLRAVARPMIFLRPENYPRAYRV